MIEEPDAAVDYKAESTQHYTPKPLALPSSSPAMSIGSLKKIRQQITQQNKDSDIEIRALTEEELHACWSLFIQKLRDKNKHSAVTNFRAAILNIVDNNCLAITTQGEIHKGFIELERSDLIEHLQNYFSNRNLTYQLIVAEKEDAETDTTIQLSKKQLYLRMIEEYPLVKELKERLKLDLE